MNDIFLTEDFLIRLARFVDCHDGCKCIAQSADGLTVQSERIASGHNTHDARVEIVTETIPATLQAVRDWLGY